MQAGDHQRGPQDEGVPRVGGGVAGDLADAPQAVPHGVRVHVERARARLERTAPLDVRRERAQQLAAGGRERCDDRVDQAPVRRRVAAERTFGQQVVGGDGARRVRPARCGAQAGERLAGAGVGADQVGSGGPDDDGAGPEGGRGSRRAARPAPRRRRAPRSGGAGSSMTSRSPCTAASIGRPDRAAVAAQVGGRRPGLGGRPADDDAHRRRGVPAERGGAGDEHVVAPPRAACPSSCGPRTTASTTSASSRASQAPRSSAAAA